MDRAPQNIIAYRNSSTAPKNAKLTIAMEYAAGGDLGSRIDKHLRAGTRFAESEVRKILAQCVDALAYCHTELHLLHRDLKPENIFLSSTGDVKLGDFGVSRTLASTGALAKTRCGTPLYMSPELARGLAYDAAADVYALGCVLYAIMALQAPWVDILGPGNANLMKLMAVIQSKKLDLTPLRRSYSPDLCDLVASMVARSAKARPSCKELLDDPLIRATMQTLPPTPPSTPPTAEAAPVLLVRRSKCTTPPTPPLAPVPPAARPSTPPSLRSGTPISLVGRPCDADGRPISRPVSRPVSSRPISKGRPLSGGMMAKVRAAGDDGVALRCAGAANAARAAREAAREECAHGVDAHAAALALQTSFRRLYRPRSPTSVMGVAPLAPKHREAPPSRRVLGPDGARGPPVFQQARLAQPMEPRPLPPIDRCPRGR